MAFAAFAHIFSTLLDLLSLFVRSEREKDLEIVLLRQQIRILQRTRARPHRLSWWEKLPVMGENTIPGSRRAFTLLHDNSRGADLPAHLVAALALVLGGGLSMRESVVQSLGEAGHG
jgi:hypothetical protein